MLILPCDTDKKCIRKLCKDIRDGLANRSELSECIREHLYNSDYYRKCSNILVYASIGSEFDTIPLIERALHDEKALFCPKIIGNDMEFYRIYDASELKPAGVYSIPEPTITLSERLFTPDKQTICIVPALTVESYGHRIGYGGGYYDRYFCKNTVGNDEITSICAIFSSLYTEYLPFAEHDMTVNIIITEEGIYNTEVCNERR
jgi:5,10-methenyltetrahydrofolate synthetase